MNIALISPNYNAISETFIKYHKDSIVGNVFYYYGGVIPTALEGYGILREKRHLFPFIHKIIQKASSFFMTNEKIFQKSLVANKIDLVVAEYGNTGAHVFNCCNNLNIPLIVVWHGYEISVTNKIIEYKDLYKKLLTSNAKHLIVSKTMEQKLVNLGGDVSKMTYSPMPPNNLFKELTPNFSNNNLLAVGRLVDKKAPYYLILAMIEVVKVFPDAILNLVGMGPLFNTCLNLINFYNLENNIILHKDLSHNKIITFFENSSVFLQHSITAYNGDQEGTPVAILEASLAGIPVVSTIHSGITNVIIDGKTGFLVEEHNVQKFANKIIKLLKDKELCKEMGQNGRNYVFENFSNTQHMNTLNSIINSFK